MLTSDQGENLNARAYNYVVLTDLGDRNEEWMYFLPPTSENINSRAYNYVVLAWVMEMRRRIG